MADMTKSIEQIGLKQEILDQVLENLLVEDAVIADIYAQCAYTESWAIEDQQVKHAAQLQVGGVGLRCVDSSYVTHHACCDGFDRDHLLSLSQNLRHGAVAPTQDDNVVVGVDFCLEQEPVESYIDLLYNIDKTIRSKDTRVTHVDASLVRHHEWVWIMDESGKLYFDSRPMTRLNVSCLLEEDGKREKGFAGGGGRGDASAWLMPDRVEQHIERALHVAGINLIAQAAPACECPVILGAGWPGVILHEAVGHGLEADFNRKGSSAYSGRVGERVASDLVTVIDDGTIDNLRGSLGVDDEGVATNRNVLIEDGILKGYMSDRLNAAMMGIKSTGNGRRESYQQLPMPRMTNTFIAPGESVLEDMIASVDYGIYAPDLAGGEVDITSGQFVFTTQEAYLIEKGQVLHPIKRVTMVGHGPSIMEEVSMVGCDFSHDMGIGICGKDGQSVPVTVGQPSIKVNSMTIGGTQLDGR